MPGDNEGCQPPWLIVPSSHKLEESLRRKELEMSDADEWIDDLKPMADLAEQQRPAMEEPDDPESAIAVEPVSGLIEADAADVADQRQEVPFDDEQISSGGEAARHDEVLPSDGEGYADGA